MRCHLPAPRIRLPLLACLATIACSWTSPKPAPPPRPEPVQEGPPGLAVDRLPLVELSLPPDNRDGKPPARALPLDRWTSGTGSGVWTTSLPTRPRALFFSSPPAGMRLLDAEGRAVPYKGGRGLQTWSIDGDTLTVVDRTRADGGPDLRGWTLQDPLAAMREAALNRAFADEGDPEAFARRTLQVGDATWTGLYLPAPASAAVDLTLPPAAELHLHPGIVPPEAADLGRSDGATLVVEVDHDGTTTEAWRGALTEGTFPATRVDLSRWAGEAVRLRLKTLPGESSRVDYVLVGDPIVAPRRARPRRVVLLFVDTLRPDHLGAFGYARPTSPWIDALADEGARFPRARSVAPWTLPAYRSVITGRMPRAWDRGPTLPDRLRAEGWATAMFAGNLYLSTRFEGSRGWGHHHLVNWPGADEQVEHGIEWLEAQDGRDALLLLHFMDPHLPYQEPESHRRRFAGDTPDGWSETFARGEVLRNRPDDAARAWITDRYDNNIRYVDDALARLGEHVGPDDLVVLFSDHGEELWDHGGFEHGHTLHDEVVRVPLILRGPGVGTGTVDGAASLLDVAPTVLDWAGLPDEVGPGRSLLPLTRGEVPADTLDTRALGLGHVLYGYERWGAVQGRSKYLSQGGVESLYDLSEDPEEQRDLWAQRLGDEVSAWRAHLSTAFDGPVVPTWRVAVNTLRSRSPQGVQVKVDAEGGIERVWLGEDAVGAGDVEAIIQDGTAVLTWPEGWRGLREVYVQPAAGLGSRPVIQARQEPGPWVRMVVPEADRTAPDGDAVPLARYDLPDRSRVELTFGVAPRPDDDATAPTGYDPELQGMLQAAGYAVGPGDD